MTPQARQQRHDRLYRWAWALIDVIVWGGAVMLACWLRFDFDLADVLVRGTAWFALGAMAGHLVVGALIGPYAVGHERGSFEEIVDLIKTVGVVGLALLAWALLTRPVMVPRSVPVTAAALALLAMFALRFAVRTARMRRNSAKKAERRAIVFGAGDGGRLLLRSMSRETGGTLNPVALLDDDKTKSRLRIQGIRVRGDRERLAKVAERYDANTLIIAIPSAQSELVRDLTDRAIAADLNVLILPAMSQLFEGKVTRHDLRDVDLEDLLSRRPIHLDTTAIAEQISGSTVLVTGAGGSIGSELCRQIAKFGPDKLYLLDRDESGLQATELSLTGHGLLDSDDIILADIRDLDTLRTVFARTRPDIVFHAAALKHLPLLESYPLEAWKTNVLGTLNVLTAASEVRVKTVVNVSTDKAANPTCALGYSKRVAERLTAGYAHIDNGGRYVSVRFGNVLGSRGSVVPAFTSQIARGGPITVTHPDVKRFFMLIPEACQLVMEAGAIGHDGEVMVLDMGEQVKIVQIAETLIRLSGRQDIEITYTGLRPGEKLGEELFSPAESHRKTSNQLVNRVDVPVLDRRDVRNAHLPSHDKAMAWMRDQSLPIESMPVEPARQVNGFDAPRMPSASLPAHGTSANGYDSISVGEAEAHHVGSRQDDSVAVSEARS